MHMNTANGKTGGYAGYAPGAGGEGGWLQHLMQSAAQPPQSNCDLSEMEVFPHQPNQPNPEAYPDRRAMSKSLAAT